LSSVRGLRELVIGVAWLGIPVAYGAALVVGMPLYLLLRQFGRVAPSAMWLSGAVIGGLVAFLLAPVLHGELFSIRFPVWAGTLLGMASAEVFRRLLETPDQERHDRVAG
jgi:zinc transporter ZupT